METDKMIKDIRMKRDAEMLDLWQKEYKQTHNELSNIRNDFYNLKHKFSEKRDECTDKEIEVLTLKQSVKDLRYQLKQEMNTSQHWFRKSSTLELEKQNDQRNAAQILQQQHEMDECETNKYKIKAWEYEKKISELTLENEALNAKNDKLKSLIDHLLSTPKTPRNYTRDTQSSMAKKVKKRLNEARSENLSHLLHDIERNVRDNLTKTKAARKEKYLLDIANY